MDNPLLIVPMMLRAKRPSRLSDMPAHSNGFWLGKSYQALTFFGHILTHSEQAARLLNNNYNATKNHEMIHLRQAQACHDSWLWFYVLYIGYYLRDLPLGKRQRREAYLLNPFEMEAYRHMNDPDYPDLCRQQGAQEWRRFAKMKLKERKMIMNYKP
ncbi:MAG: hypothetical protein J1E77_01060 [Prevotella sp.]|nr:hypothetical protein [Prevotella sp.]